MGESQGNIKPFSHGAETDPSLLNNNLRNYGQIGVICGHILENMPNQGEKPVFLQLIWIAEARNVHKELDSSV